MADLVERLRAQSFVICGEAADEIERLRCDNAIKAVETALVNEAYADGRADQKEDDDAETERLRLDAARYRWLRDVADADSGHPYVTIHQTNDWGKWLNTWECGEGLDAAIDAAMAGEGS